MSYAELPQTFQCGEDLLFSILSLPQKPWHRGVLVVVGGPQYRVGSHRQFTLLARHLAGEGIPAMRFDYRGMGDSEGSVRSFEEIEEDIRCAIDHFFSQVPGMREVAIWGLCDAASAALFYAYQDRRVCGLILLNPWIRTSEGAAKAYLKHYYVKRLADPELWRKIAAGEFRAWAAARSLFGVIGNALGVWSGRANPGGQEAGKSAPPRTSVALPKRMAEGFARFKGRVLLILSGRDLTAQEFLDTTGRSRKWRKLLASRRVTRRELPEADHTFSRREWRDQVAAWTAEWMRMP